MTSTVSGTVPLGDPISSLEKSTMRKIHWRIIPYVIFVYFLCFIDRINISFAGDAMKAELGLTATMFGMGAGIFFIGYFIAEIPSNILLERFGARKWIARIMISWGTLSTLMFLVKGEYSFYALRFALGFAEAGFFPGIILYFTYWFPARYRARVSSKFLMASPLSTMVGAPLSSWILQYFHGINNMPGWQWLFIVEGIPTVLFGIITLFYLTDRPKDAKWLEKEEQEWIDNEIMNEKKQIQARRHFSLKDALTSPIVLVLGFVYFCTQMPPYAVFMWIPQLVKQLGTLTTTGSFTQMEIGFISAIPAFCAIVGLAIWGWNSDRTMERKWHFTSAAVFACISMLIATYFIDIKSPILALFFLSLCVMGMYALMAVFWAIPPTILTGAAAAGGIAFINSIGNLGGFVGPYAIGYLYDKTGGYVTGLIVQAVVIFLGGLVCYLVMNSLKAQGLADHT